MFFKFKVWSIYPMLWLEKTCRNVPKADYTVVGFKNLRLPFGLRCVEEWRLPHGRVSWTSTTVEMILNYLHNFYMILSQQN